MGCRDTSRPAGELRPPSLDGFGRARGSLQRSDSVSKLATSWSCAGRGGRLPAAKRREDTIERPVTSWAAVVCLAAFGFLVRSAYGGDSCGSDSDCAGYGKCRDGKCGGCGSDSDCNGNGKCSNNRCGA